MTPARILAICRDEWPALRWRWERRPAGRLREKRASVLILTEIGEPYSVVGVGAAALADGRRATSKMYPLTKHGIRAALREARRAVTS